MNKKLAIYGIIGLLAGSAVTAVAIARSPKMQPKQETHHSQEHHMGMGENSHNHHHHEQEQITESYQAKLTVPKGIAANQNVTLGIDIQDNAGNAIAKFDTFQEQLMQLIVVSDDLQVFDRIHPTYKNNGHFEVNTRFPQPGNYTLFSNYKPSGKSEQISVLKAQLSGKIITIPIVDFNHSKNFGKTKVNFSLSQPQPKVGKEVTLIFNLQQTSNDQPITDLQLYLGEKGHLVIIKQSSPLTKANYIHAHAVKDSPSHQVQFITRFPRAGIYKLWGEFNCNDKIIIADFWVNVIE
jgi:hypothetical protein